MLMIPVNRLRGRSIPPGAPDGYNGGMADTTTDAPEVLYEVDDHVATITLNRPHRLNAISTRMLDELARLLLQAENDDGVRCVVLTGAGKGFCSGLDLIDASSGSGIGSDASMPAGRGVRHFRTRDVPTIVLHQMDTPVIAAINGAAAGFGLDIALGADIRLAARGAKLAPGFAKRGVVPESGGTWYLPRLLGWAKAAEIGFLGRDLTGQEAKDLGLVNDVADSATEVQAMARDWAGEIASNAPLAVQAIKRLYRHGLSQDFESHTHHVLLQVMHLFQSRDFREGVTSYLEKRPPEFEGR
jgi:enoyl-CoA hydratase/carnithine racemase